MKTSNLFASSVMFCAAAVLVGCANTERRVSASSFGEKDLQRAEAPPSPAPSPPVLLDESASRKLDLNADGTVNLDEWQRFDTSAEAKENFSALNENSNGQINVAESLSQAPQHSKRYHFFGDKDKTNDSYFSWDDEVFQQPGLQLFSIYF